MNNQLEGMATLLIKESIKLESSNANSISHYMVMEHGIDWDDSYINKEISKALNSTMMLVRVYHNGKFIENQWKDKF